MAWTDPRTWLAGEDPTAAVLNIHIRDNFKAIGDPWTAYTPVWGASTTNPVIGNGTLTGNYIQAGKLVIWRFQINSGTTTTYGTGNYTISLPVAMVAGLGYPAARLLIQNTSTFYSRTMFSTGSTTVLAAADEAGARWSNTVPFTAPAATANTKWTGYGVYEAA